MVQTTYSEGPFEAVARPKDADWEEDTVTLRYRGVTRFTLERPGVEALIECLKAALDALPTP